MSDLHVAFGEHPPGTKLPNTRVVVHGELVAVDAVTARLVFLKLCSPSERDKSAGGEVAVLLKDRDGYLTREEIEELRALLEERLASGAAPPARRGGMGGAHHGATRRVRSSASAGSTFARRNSAGAQR